MAALVIFIFGLALFLLGNWSRKNRLTILRNGVEVIGTVTSMSKCFDNNRYQYKIMYNTQENKTINGIWDEFHSLPYCKKHPIGSTYKIVYLPENPTKFVVKGESELDIGFVFMSFIGIALIVFSFFIFINAFKIM